MAYDTDSLHLPWTAHKNGRGEKYYVEGTPTQAEKDAYEGGNPRPPLIAYDLPKDVAELIAAAPETLIALKALSSLEVRGHALIDRLQFSDEGRQLSAQIRTAIAKAEPPA